MDPMEPRPFLHNSHNRYTHDSLPPFPAPSFSGDRNFYQIHHHHLPPPPPPPPLHLQPPPPPLHPPLPPYPPTYHHHRPSKFNFLNSHHPIEDDPRKSVFNINYHPRVPDRIVFDQPRSVPHHPATFPEDLPRMPRPEFGDTHLDSRQNFCDPFRVHADNRPARLFHETHPHPFDHHPMSPFRSAPSGSFLGQERFEDDVEISRLLGFSRDGFDQHRKEELFRGQNDGLSNDDYHCRGLVLEPPPSSNNFRMAASGEPRSHSGFFSDNERPWDDGIRDNVDDNQVWGATRLSPGELQHSPVEIENAERIRDGEFRLASGKRMTHFSKLGKLKNRLRGDGNQEFMRTPRKKPQKTSALLRIGKHAPRKRNDEQLYVSAYFNDSKSGPFRGKGHLRQEKGREGSPVELDVTFKSNALVAKAIGPSSPFPGSVGDPSFRNKIFRKSVVPVLGSSSSDPAEFHVGSVNGVSASLDMGAASSSDKVPMQSEDGTVVSGIGIVSDSSPPLTYPVIPLPGNNTVEGSLNSMVSVGSATSDKKSSLKTRKKRKRLFGLSTSPITGIHDVPINADPSNQGLYAASNSENVIAQLAQENIFSGIESADVLLKDSAAEVSSNAAVSVGDDTNPNGTTSGKGLTHSEEKVTESGLGAPDDVGLHRCPDGAFKLLEDNAVQGSPPAMVSVEVASGIGTMGSDTPTLKIKRKRKVMTSPLDIPISREDEIPAGPMTRSSSKHSMGTALCPDKDLTQADNNVPISGNDTVAPVFCPSEVAIPLGNSSVEVSTEAEVTVGSGIIVCSEGMCTPKAKQKMKLTSPLSALSSPLVSEIQEGSLDPDRSIYDANVRFSKCLIGAEEKVAFSVTGSVHDVALPCLDGTTISLEKSVVELSPKLTFLVREGSNVDYTSKLENPCMISSSVSEDSAIPDMRSPCSSGCRGEQQDVIPITDATNCQENGCNFHSLHMETGNVREERVEVTAAEVTDTICRETCDDVAALESYTQEKIESVPLEPRALDLADRLSSKNMECTDYNLRHEGEFPSLFGHSSQKTQVSGTSTDSNEKLIESVPDTLPKVDSLESFSMSLGLHILNGYTSNEHVSVDRTRVDEEPIVRDGFLSTSNNSRPVEPIINVKSDHRVQSGLSIPKKAAPTPLGSLQDTKQDKPSLKSMSKDSNVRKNHQSYAVPGIFPGRSSLASGSLKKATSSTHIAKPRTWHRTENSASPFSANYSCSSTGISQRQSPKKFAKAQSSSYIRKGNSLVRKSAPVVASPLGPTGLISTSHRLNPVTINESKVSIDTLNCSRTNGEDPLSERPKTPPLPCNTKSPNCTANSFKGCMPPTLGNHSCKGASETVPDPLRRTDSKDAAKPDGSSESQAGISKSIEIQSFLNDRSSNSLNMKRMIYVKRKSNQLVAASSPEICDPSVHVAEKNQAIGSSLSSDHYYKRNKNQLILTSSESHLKNAVAIPDDSSNSDGQMASNVSSLTCSRNLSRQKPNKALRKGCKPSKFSLVWKLHDTKSQNNDSNSLQHRKVLPYLFPWKRSASWRHFIYNTASVSKNSSLSLISSRLMLSRKINTVYARSTGGFSLRKSKVLSVGGSNLKWSKSIERRSKKVNEEATRAVAAVERKKREQKVASCATADAKHRRHQSSRKSGHGIELRPGERIFRIGSVRYKMDSSKRTLQRIPDERSSGAIDFQSENGTKKSFVPRRLLIGNDEYVRLGNGNQLIRDPKKLTRILASEKVRWSLHTARLRLARKQKYCQFFTRFGKCNKDEGKCPYIHDPSKIAVCTKFLKGLCSNANCKLTHKVIPERMQDCSYFLRGLCTNQSCPYRHVNVNPNACVCEGFLRGYCADGDECRKKHSYVCPIYGATGVCPQGSLCKLHHPKNRNKGKKRKRSKEQKNARGRYFGSKLVDIPDSRAAVAEEHTTRNQEDIFFHEGRFADYISLDVSDEEAKETNDPTNTRTSDSDPSDLQLDDLDEIIKPVLIMKLQ